MEAAEGRPGLSDHRQQGRQLLEGQREEARAGDSDSHTERDKVRGRKKENSQYGAEKAEPSIVQLHSAP